MDSNITVKMSMLNAQVTTVRECAPRLMTQLEYRELPICI